MSWYLLLLIAIAFAIAAFLALVLRVAHPYHRRLALTLYVTGWFPFLLSIHRFWVEYDSEITGLLVWKWHIAIGAGLLACLWIFKTLLPLRRTPLLGIEIDELQSQLSADLQTLDFLSAQLQQSTSEFLESVSFHGSELTPSETAELRAIWCRFMETMFALDIVKRRYRAFFQVNGFAHPRPHAEAFLVAFSAFVSQYLAATTISARVGPYESLKKCLDEPHPDAGMEAGSLSRIQRMITHPDEILRLNAGRAYLRLMRRRLPRDNAQLLRTENQLRQLQKRVWTEFDPFMKNPLDLLERHAANAWFPVQKGVALGIASVRTVSRDYFLTKDVLEGEVNTLLPGDILLTRREWHLTNLGIPGYWTHAALFVGSLKQWNRYFDDVAMPDGVSPSQQLATLHPRAFEALRDSMESDDTPIVMEALRPGVIAQPFIASASADSLAVLRPRVSKQDQWNAILAAMPHLGKPYNYQFDFRTESSLVCSQLIYKAYETASSLQLKPRMSGGRLLLSPNDIAIKYDREFNTAEQQLDFVLFLDGIAPGSVKKRDSDALRSSWSRPKWHILLDHR